MENSILSFNPLRPLTRLMALALLGSALTVSYAADNSGGRSYVMPPTQATTGSAPVISDAEMQKCVEMYNQANWLDQELAQMQVDLTSESSVNTYNTKVNQVNALTRLFNAKCAGKQSESACREANRLNREKGLPEVSCAVN